ncbi:MAG: hypothetical protein QNK23_02565 [Crocinitomicaceae bacterium]|nr:hypothetical protein [Crocinitomicaceae bacterium]
MKNLSFFIVLLLFSCANTPENQETAPDTISELSIEEQILLSYDEAHIFFNDTLQRNDTVYFHAASVKEEINLNGDGFMDFFIVLDYMGGPTTGAFHDGKTGELIEFYPSYESIVSKPGIEIETTILQIHPGDNYEELMVLSGGGGTVENHHYMEIYRYDSTLNAMKLIFNETISLFEWDENLDEHLVRVNYIDAIYHPFYCCYEITVGEGAFMDTITPYNLDIMRVMDFSETPPTNQKRYVFDPGKNTFVEGTPPEHYEIPQ